MDLARLGEFGLIERIENILGEGPEEVVVGMGDDAAVFRWPSGRLGVITTDALVEGVHFDFDYTPWESLGWKALAINLSDIAAMGGEPRYAVVSIALTGKNSVEDVASFYEGMRRCGSAYGCTVIGGDTVRSRSDAMVSVTVLGDADEDRLVRRCGARAGDLLCVTGSLGGARVGLEALSSGDDDAYPESVGRFLEPHPRVKEAIALIDGLRPTAMIDVSDGLTSEIGHICRESGVGCRVDENQIPVSDEAVEWAEKEELSPTEVALTSGEEYELLFTVNPASYDAGLKTSRSDEYLFAVVGEITPKEEGIRMRSIDGETPLTVKGWDHFSV